MPCETRLLSCISGYGIARQSISDGEHEGIVSASCPAAAEVNATNREQVLALPYSIQISAAERQRAEVLVDGLQQRFGRGESAMSSVNPVSHCLSMGRTLEARAAHQRLWRSASSLPTIRCQFSKKGTPLGLAMCARRTLSTTRPRPVLPKVSIAK